jgi:hypothetical protein
VVSFLYDKVGNAHLLLSLKVLSSWSFYAIVLLFLQEGKVWMFQFFLITYMSLATKMEQIKVPILLDFQVEFYTVLEVY